MSGAALDTAAELAKLGDVAGAARVLGDALDAPDAPSGEARTLLLQTLIGHLITSSGHRAAVARAHELQAHVGVARAPLWWVDLLTLVMRFVPRRFRPGGLAAKTLGYALRAGALRNGATMESIRALQLAFFWHDIRACQRLSLLQLVLARSDRDVRRALAWLGYSYGYAGQGDRGLPVLRGALALAHGAGDQAMLVETYPLLAIAYQMCDQPRRALHYHRLFQRRHAQDSAFYELLSHTNSLVSLVSLGRFEELRAQLDKTFHGSFALDASRHHIQIYGVNAVLLAVEGHATEAAKVLALAKAAAHANDDPLDWTIYSRLAALAHVMAGRFEGALACAEEGLARNRAYGVARFYDRELRELAAIARAPDWVTPRRAHLLAASARYLAAELGKQRESTADLELSPLAEQLAEALRSHFEFDPSRPPTEADLRTKLARTFKTDYVVFARDLASLKATVLRDQAIDHVGITTSANGELRFVCPGGKFFLGIACTRTSEFKDELAVGVLLERLDALSESLVRAAFRLVLSQYVFVHSIRISRDIQAKQQRAAAVGTLAQMLAHDVRRPFRMIRTALDVLERTRDPDELRKLAAALLPEVKAATDTADGLIADVMEISSGSSEAHPEPVWPEVVIGASLVETLREYPTADVRFAYDFAHRGAIHVEAKKVQRVFSNIVANAMQAMDHRGCISFTTSEVTVDGRAMVSFVVANDGPPISDADAASLFDPFFTRNKPGGTGLGLAIAHRVVTAHGGTIACVATGGRGAAFRFTLPSIAARVPTRPPMLPACSTEITSRVPAPPGVAEGPPSSKGNVTPEIAIVDDSRAFLMGWRTALAGNAGAHFFTSPEAFWKAIEDDPLLVGRLSAVVTDYRFANSRQTGISFARAVKQRRAELPVFLASSGYVSQREIQGVIDVELDKDHVSWDALSAALGETSRRSQARMGVPGRVS